MTATAWFGDLISFLFFIGCAWAVLKKNWYKPRPILSIYIFTLAITGPWSVALYLLQDHPSSIQYTLCRLYSAEYFMAQLLIYFFQIAVLYEFLFHMAGNKKTIRKAAVTGFAITLVFTIYATYELLIHAPQTSNRLSDAATFSGRIAVLSLLISGILVFVIKWTPYLLLETKLTVALAALAFVDFIQTLIGFMMRKHNQIATMAAQVIWISFSILLYIAVKNGPDLTNKTSEPIAVQS
jgi:hypothetical protein